MSNQKSNQFRNPGVNFIKILHAAFTRADPKSAKKYSQAISPFALLGSVHVCKSLGEICW